MSPFGACQVLFKCFTCLVTREEPFVEGAAAAAGRTASLMDVFLFLLLSSLLLVAMAVLSLILFFMNLIYLLGVSLSYLLPITV